ncbi:hypothetical protein MMC10_009115 [Thelotrema lepadinum]|nr:hypothetical protein [Thelotrema lepadinum]
MPTVGSTLRSGRAIPETPAPRPRPSPKKKRAAPAAATSPAPSAQSDPATDSDSPPAPRRPTDADLAEAQLQAEAAAADAAGAPPPPPPGLPQIRSRRLQSLPADVRRAAAGAPPPPPSPSEPGDAFAGRHVPRNDCLYLLMLLLGLLIAFASVVGPYVNTVKTGLSSGACETPEPSVLPAWPTNYGIFWKPAIKKGNLDVSGRPSLCPRTSDATGLDDIPVDTNDCSACPLPVSIPLSKLPASVCQGLMPFYTLTDRQILWLNERNGFSHSLSTPAWEEFNDAFGTDIKFEELMTAWQMSPLGPIDSAADYVDEKPKESWFARLFGRKKTNATEGPLHPSTYEARRCEACRSCSWRVREGLLGDRDDIVVEKWRELTASSRSLSSASSSFAASSRSVSNSLVRQVASASTSISSASASASAQASREAAMAVYEAQRRAAGTEWGWGLENLRKLGKAASTSSDACPSCPITSTVVDYDTVTTTTTELTAVNIFPDPTPRPEPLRHPPHPPPTQNPYLTTLYAIFPPTYDPLLLATNALLFPYRVTVQFGAHMRMLAAGVNPYTRPQASQSTPDDPGTLSNDPDHAPTDPAWGSEPSYTPAEEAAYKAEANPPVFDNVYPYVHPTRLPSSLTPLFALPAFYTATRPAIWLYTRVTPRIFPERYPADYVPENFWGVDWAWLQREVADLRLQLRGGWRVGPVHPVPEPVYGQAVDRRITPRWVGWHVVLAGVGTGVVYGGRWVLGL